MALVISPEQIAEIRYQTHRPVFGDAMMRLDERRFRALGPDVMERFCRHGWRAAEALGLRYVNDITYVLFLMTFLGAHFLDDFRFEAIAAPLKAKPAGGMDYRVRDARRAFLAFGEGYIGPEGAFYRADLGRFLDWVAEAEPSADEMVDGLAACHGEGGIEIPPDARARLKREGTESAAALGLDPARGPVLALALRYWLGLRFEADPLYPWVVDVTARESSPKGRTDALRRYALKRMRAELRG